MDCQGMRFSAMLSSRSADRSIMRIVGAERCVRHALLLHATASAKSMIRNYDSFQVRLKWGVWDLLEGFFYRRKVFSLAQDRPYSSNEEIFDGKLRLRFSG